MANYQNSLGESELFGRMTAGFAKVCESVQSGKFVRNEMGVICESVCEDDENAGAAPEAGTEGAAPEGETADAGATADAGTEGATQDADVASATPEQINGSVTECGNAEKKPLKKLIPEGCCGGKAKKVLKEAVQKLCKTCGNPLDETGTCQDCQGYSEVKEGEGDLKVNLKANAKANQEKVAQAIRDGKADGIVKEGLDYHKNVDKITKDDMFGMLVNLLYQIRDGVSVEDVTTNPDIDEFDDYSLDEVLELAKKYEV